MNRIVVYGSKYGTTKMYADELAHRLGVESVSYRDVKNLDDYNSIIYLGGLYIGGVLGVKETFDKISNPDDKELVLISVGLSSFDDSKNIQAINNGVKKRVLSSIYNNLHFYHLRGGIDYSKLDFKDKMAMKIFYLGLKRKPEVQRTGLVKTIIDTYNKEVSFVDFNELDGIIDSITKKVKI